MIPRRRKRKSRRNRRYWKHQRRGEIRAVFCALKQAARLFWAVLGDKRRVSISAAVPRGMLFSRFTGRRAGELFSVLPSSCFFHNCVMYRTSSLEKKQVKTCVFRHCRFRCGCRQQSLRYDQPSLALDCHTAKAVRNYKLRRALRCRCRAEYRLPASVWLFHLLTATKRLALDYFTAARGVSLSVFMNRYKACKLCLA